MYQAKGSSGWERGWVGCRCACSQLCGSRCYCSAMCAELSGETLVGNPCAACQEQHMATTHRQLSLMLAQPLTCMGTAVGTDPVGTGPEPLRCVMLCAMHLLLPPSNRGSCCSLPSVPPAPFLFLLPAPSLPPAAPAAASPSAAAAAAGVPSVIWDSRSLPRARIFRRRASAAAARSDADMMTLRSASESIGLPDARGNGMGNCPHLLHTNMLSKRTCASSHRALREFFHCQSFRNREFCPASVAAAACGAVPSVAATAASDHGAADGRREAAPVRRTAGRHHNLAAVALRVQVSMGCSWCQLHQVHQVASGQQRTHRLQARVRCAEGCSAAEGGRDPGVIWQ